MKTRTITPEEEKAEANPSHWQTITLRGHGQRDISQHQTLSAALSHAASHPRTTIYTVGKNGMSVPYSKDREIATHP